MVDRILSIIGTVFAVSGGLLALAAFDRLSLPGMGDIAVYRSSFLTAGGVMFVVAMALLAVPLVMSIYAAGQVVTEGILGYPERVAHGVEVTRVAEDQLGLSYRLIVDLLGREGVRSTLDFARYERMWRACPEVYHLVWNCADPAHPAPKGFINVFPITQEAGEAMLAGTLRGRDLEPEHVSTGSETRSFYIGAIAGRGMRTKADILRVLDNRLAQLALRDTPCVFYTVPFTRRGRAAARRYGFRPQLSYADGAQLWIKIGAASSP